MNGTSFDFCPFHKSLLYWLEFGLIDAFETQSLTQICDVVISAIFVMRIDLCFNRAMPVTLRREARADDSAAPFADGIAQRLQDVEVVTILRLVVCNSHLI